MTFTALSDKIVRKKTAGVFIIFSFIPLFNLFHSSDRWIWYFGFFLFFMLILLFTYLHRPTKYLVDANRVVICRPVKNVEIDIQDIKLVNRIPHDLLKNSTRGGALGYFGNFNSNLGKIRFYATRRDRLVMLTKYDNSKIILTPDQEDQFIEALEMNIRSR